MEVIKKIVPERSLEQVYNKLLETHRMYAPVASGNKHEFKYNPPFAEIAWDYVQTIQSPKNVVFPRVEKLFAFNKGNEGDTIQDIDLSKVPEVLVWGLHPCDAISFGILKKIFLGDFSDVFFQERLKKLTLIGLSCRKGDSNCFCTSLGSGPGDTRGSDILLTQLNDGNFLAEIITEKGKMILDQNPEMGCPAIKDVKNEFLATIKNHFDQNVVTENLKGMFDHPFWVENSLRCIGCGACTYVCPICSCFDIQDEKRGRAGDRLRCWDSCGTSLFTMHAGGHNPRSEQSQRWRQRIMHKFSYQPESIGTPGCVGCGRCSRGCPVDMNILEQLVMIGKIK